MRKVSLIRFAMACSGVFAASAVAQEAAKTAQTPASTVPTIDQSLEWQSASSPKISPDGKRVVYEVQKTNWEENAFERNLWIAEIATGETHALTTAKKSSTNPAWSPDGKWIAFLSDRPGQILGTAEGKKQLYLISTDGGEAQQLRLVESVRCEHICHRRLPRGDRARLVEYHGLNLVRRLQRRAAFNQDAALCAAPRADHNRGRRR